MTDLPSSSFRTLSLICLSWLWLDCHGQYFLLPPCGPEGEASPGDQQVTLWLTAIVPTLRSETGELLNEVVASSMGWTLSPGIKNSASRNGEKWREKPSISWNFQDDVLCLLSHDC